MKEETLEYYRKVISKMYEEEPYLRIRYSSKEIAEKMGISENYMRKLFSDLGFTYEKDVIQLLTDFPPYFYTYTEIIKKTGLKINRETLNRYSMRLCGIKLTYITEKMNKEIEEDFESMIEEYPYPFLQLGKVGMCKYMGVKYKKISRMLKERGMTLRKEINKIVKDYPPGTYAVVEIAQDLNADPERLYKIFKKRDKHYPYIKTVKRLKAEKERYGVVNKDNRLSMKSLKEYFENTLKTRGYITSKEIRELGYDDFSKVIYTIKKRYGLNVEYKYDRSKMQYNLIKTKENKDD